MSEEKSVRTAKRAGRPRKAAGEPGETTALAPIALDQRAEETVCAIARRLKLADGYEAAKETWLKCVVDDGGEAAARGIVNFLSALANGEQQSVKALEANGLQWSQLVMYSEADERFRKVLMDTYRIRKGVAALRKVAMGDEVLNTAYELATEGEKQYNKQTGEYLGHRKKSEKMLDRLLILSGREFARDGSALEEGGVHAGGATAGGITLNFHFDGKDRPAFTTEVIDV